MGRWARRFAIPTRFRGDRFRPATLLVLLSALGLAAYMFYLWRRWDDPLLFYRVQSYWNHGPGRGWKSLLKYDLAGGLLHWTHPSFTLTSSAQALLTGGALLATPFVGRRFGWGYGVYVGLTVVIIFVSSADFLGAGGYLMSLFPLAALSGEWLAERPRTRLVTLGVCAVALVFLNGAWARNAYLT